MTASPESSSRDELIVSIQSQLGPCDVSDLNAHLERNVLFQVDVCLDLLEVALALAEDDKKQVEPWLTKQLLKRVTAEDLSQWRRAGKSLQSAIVAPWVLIQLQPGS